MTSNLIYLEVDKSNGAIMSYFFELPLAKSTTADYVPATHTELAYLNALEDCILPAGMVVTLTDLEDHRKRVQAVKKTAGQTSQKRSESVSKATGTNPSSTSNNAKASLIATLRRYRNSKGA